MALFTDSEVRARAQSQFKNDYRPSYVKTADMGYKLAAASLSFSESKTYDIFLSHSIKDAELIFGLKGIFEDLGYSVYVDWIEDPQLDRSNVTPATADKLRRRMRTCKSLFYVTTSNASNSKWMPWECGYFDGIKEKIAIVPVMQYAQSEFKGQEYLGLYPYCAKVGSSQQQEYLLVYKNSKTYLWYNTWVSTQDSSLVWNTLP